MELGAVTSVQPSPKLHVALSSPTIALSLDLPEGIDGETYFTILASSIASDFELLTSSVKAVKAATITASNEDLTSSGEEMSERIAKIEQSLKHLAEGVSAIDAKLDKLIAMSSDEKAVSAVLRDKFVEYDRKLDKKPNKDEVEKILSQGINKQIIWTIGTIVALALIAYKILSH